MSYSRWYTVVGQSEKGVGGRRRPTTQLGVDKKWVDLVGKECPNQSYGALLLIVCLPSKGGLLDMLKTKVVG